ncbi:MAG: glycoside hydrolase family 3 protein [Aristaeellaceae bacterium]
MKAIRPVQLSGVPSTTPRAYEAPHAALARLAAAEGMVLLKNEDSTLPLAAASRLALFGAGATHTIKGGTGSGDVNERYSVTIAQGLRDAGYVITTQAWMDEFDRLYAQARQQWREGIFKRIADGMNFWEAYSTQQFAMPAGGQHFATDADTAIYIISRIAGENADRYAAGSDYFLSEQEHETLRQICSLYARVVVIINAGGVVDLSFLDEFTAIKAVLVVSQPGMEGGHAVADVLSGAVNPSGKLTDTWALRYEDYPNAATFSHNNGDTDHERYEEGIYVGYRYFDSFDVPVRCGFGYGLSYTDFGLSTEQVTVAADGRVQTVVCVTNTGKVAGREVVQVYAALPDGRLEKEARRLVAFGKTALLAPGESQKLTLTFAPDALASFDEEGSAWVLEQGVYGVYVGTSLAGSQLAATLTLAQDKVLTRTMHICPMQEELTVLSCPAEKRAARYAALCQAAEQLPRLDWDLSAVATRTVDYTVTDPQDEAAAITDTLSVEQLIRLATGEVCDSAAEALGAAGRMVPGSAAQTSGCAQEQGVASIVLADGPAGLRLTQHYYVKDGKPCAMDAAMNMEHGELYTGPEPEGEKYYQFCTAMPVGTLLAQSWDMELLQRMGDLIGEEMEIFGVQLWLAPGMNIHRNPLCGRNFEYFAEDPLLSGLCAAALTRGVQSHPGVGVTIKHYACNNQEDNRMGSDSILTERTLREIYLKGFELAIREGHPMAIMTSYNLINGVHAANCYDICTNAARCEFGFDGMIMTDWTTTNVDDKCTAAGCMRAGNDSVMPGMPMDHDNLRRELDAGTLTLADLKRCIARLVRLTLNTNRYE